MATTIHERPGTTAAAPAIELTRAVTRAVRAQAAVVLVVEVVCIALSMADHGWTIFLIAHASVLVMLVLTILSLDDRGLDSTQAQKLAFLTFVAGPIGTAAAIISEGSLMPSSPRELDEWYDTIAPPENAAVTLVDRIIDGRLVNNSAQLPRRFDQLLSTGSPEEKRAVLSFLALESDRPGMPDALKIALQSPDQGIRVQAAAVAAHVRDKARRRTSNGNASATPGRATNSNRSM